MKVIKEIKTDFETIAKPIVEEVLKDSLATVITKHYANYDDYSILIKKDESKYSWMPVATWDKCKGNFESREEAVRYAIKNDWPLYVMDSRALVEPILKALNGKKEKN